tara:strand:- start:532 stop:1035 length:504 start_codon:yes stop_codon:yes gene_type:complete
MISKSEWLKDISDMHDKFEAKEWIDHMYLTKNYKLLDQFLAFRLDFIEEEFEETIAAFAQKDHKEVADGLIDLIVVAIGTLDLFDMNADAIWAKVYKANITKSKGINTSRPNPFGLPDMVKPEGWKAPKITDADCGMLPEIFKNLITTPDQYRSKKIKTKEGDFFSE